MATLPPSDWREVLYRLIDSAPGPPDIVDHKKVSLPGTYSNKIISAYDISEVYEWSEADEVRESQEKDDRLKDAPFS